MDRLCLALSLFPDSMPPHLTGRILATKDSIAAVLSATRRAWEVECVGALRTTNSPRDLIQAKPR
jgi:hypothetical protein